MWSRLKGSGGKALVPYITPEYPFPGLTVPLMEKLADAGAAMIEVGVPFSDPLADGATIQRSSDAALRNGVTIDSILRDVAVFRKNSETPVVLMGYCNPMAQYGLEQFVQRSVAAGIDGLIVPDLPPEEAGDLREKSLAAGLSNIFLIAPTTSTKRVALIDSLSTDCSYCVSVTGVTGTQASVEQNGSLGIFLDRVRSTVGKPFVVGFGLSSPDDIRYVWQYADGAVIGSSLIRALESASNNTEALGIAGSFFRSMKGEG